MSGNGAKMFGTTIIMKHLPMEVLGKLKVMIIQESSVVVVGL
jgi:hypothetical protein